jgi:hypothetical protein
MTDQPVTNIVDLANQFRKALEQRDNKALSQIIKAYGDIYTRLQDKISVLTLEMANMETITAASVRKLDSYKSLIIEIEKELTKFQGYAGTVMQQSANDAVKMGVTNARLLTLAGNPAVAASFKNLNPRAVENLVSYFGEGSPLMARLDKLAGENALRVAQTIIDNVALGNNPKTIAGLIKNSLGGGLTDALRMTRTVQIYSYREANRATYLANFAIVKSWIWYANLGANCCMSCVSMHGTEHTLDEVLDDHHNGECTMLPLTIGMENPVTSGESWFKEQPEAMQKQMMGDSKFEAWQGGKFSFDQLSTTKTNDVFGDMRAETSLKDLLESSENIIDNKYLPQIESYPNPGLGQRSPTEKELIDFENAVKNMPNEIRKLEPISEETRTVSSLKNGEFVPKVLDDKLNISVIEKTELSEMGTAYSKGNGIFIQSEFVGTPIQDHEYIHSLTNRNIILRDGLQEKYNPENFFFHAENAQNKLGEQFTMVMTEYNNNKQVWIDNVAQIYLGIPKEDAISYAVKEVDEINRFLKELGLW